MQITKLLGSAKKKGSTAVVLGWVEKELETPDHLVARICLHTKGGRSPLLTRHNFKRSVYFLPLYS